MLIMAPVAQSRRFRELGASISKSCKCWICCALFFGRVCGFIGKGGPSILHCDFTSEGHQKEAAKSVISAALTTKTMWGDPATIGRITLKKKKRKRDAIRNEQVRLSHSVLSAHRCFNRPAEFSLCNKGLGERAVILRM